MKEFIEELKYNQGINFEKGLENRIDIDYVIERLENIFSLVYDNGYQMLGSVENMKKYIKYGIKYNEEQGLEVKELKDLLEETKEYSDKDIILIDYDRPMGFGLYLFNSKWDEMKIKESE